MTATIGQGPTIRRNQPQDQPPSLIEDESSLLSRILSSAEECIEGFSNCLPELLAPGVKYLWVPVAVVVGVVAKVNLAYLTLSILGLLALQLIYIHLIQRAPTIEPRLDLFNPPALCEDVQAGNIQPIEDLLRRGVAVNGPDTLLTQRAPTI